MASSLEQPMEHPIEQPEEVEHTSLGVNHGKLGLWVFLGSEAVFFAGLISTYLVVFPRSVVGPFPQEVLSIPLVSINTFVLIASSLAMVTALANAQEGRTRKAILWLAATAVLGLVFLGGQVYEFIHLYTDQVSMSHNLFGAGFFTLTGTHGLHVLSGIIWIILVMLQMRQGRFGKDGGAGKIEVLGLYWHFVDLIWIIIFTVVYLIQ